MKRIQQELSSHLLERLEYIKLSPNHILTLGDLVSEYTPQLSNKYPTAQITTSNNNNIAFDLIIAIIADTDTQLNDFISSLAALRNSLTTNGLLLFSCFAKGNISIDLHHIGDAMLNAKLTDPVVDVERIRLESTEDEFEVVYGHALGVPSHKPSLNSDGSVNIPIDSIARL